MSEKQLTEAMGKALKVARESETPFGAVLVNANFKVVSAAANSTGTDGLLAHAEMNLLSLAGAENSELSGYILVSTCEPCPMCMGAILWHGIEKVYYGASIDDASNYMQQLQVSAKELAEKAGIKAEVQGGILRDECIELFESFG
ncbi:MAG TPA: nucleoside deaminase [Cryomorphaceae bacterium]|nr:nucleoside deaminase [Cryomorphaceae bacterium]